MYQHLTNLAVTVRAASRDQVEKSKKVDFSAFEV